MGVAAILPELSEWTLPILIRTGSLLKQRLFELE